ncbi:uncharacterized protein LOC111350996 [Spodoptera litura]|uniref:Uncharacterized protein LOC111350996 n=1 Tax=Spodoptera litura TaxID=69820 RepID=A0A9J7DUP8_SPOLT|nr:uncharacterized protein LOC111350996 [Spodoptera litura]
MKITLLLIAVCLAVCLASAASISSDRRHVLINKPKIDEFGPRAKRSPWPWARPGGGVKGYRPAEAPPSELQKKVRKGEFVCGNKICKLEPGVEPAGCNGLCQYPIH